MIPKKPAPDLIRGGHRLSEKITLEQLERDDDSKRSRRAPAVRVSAFAADRTPQCGAGAAVAAGGVGTICCGALVAARAGGRGGCGGWSPRRAGAGGGVGTVAVVAFGSGFMPGSGVMMLTGGIEAAEGKSYFDGTATEGGLEAVV
jgi:hypothetical protein